MVLIPSFTHEKYIYYKLSWIRNNFPELLVDQKNVINFVRLNDCANVILHCNLCKTFYKNVKCNIMDHSEYIIIIKLPFVSGVSINHHFNSIRYIFKDFKIKNPNLKYINTTSDVSTTNTSDMPLIYNCNTNDELAELSDSNPIEPELIMAENTSSNSLSMTEVTSIEYIDNPQNKEIIKNNIDFIKINLSMLEKLI